MALPLRFPPLPVDILKEIAGSLDPSTIDGIFTLQQLRLVNRTFHAFATPVLFRGFDTFSFGEDYEDTDTRIRTLAASDLRRRVRKLGIPRSCMLPRAVRKRLADKNFPHNSLESMEDSLADGFRDQMDNLLNVMGRDFRFHEIRLGSGEGTIREILLYNGYYIHSVTESHFIHNVFPLLHEKDAFTEVKSLRTVLPNFEIETLLEENSYSKFHCSVHEVDIYQDTLSEAHHFDRGIGGILCLRLPNLRKLTARYPQTGRLEPLIVPEDSQYINNRIEYLRIIGGEISTEEQSALRLNFGMFRMVSELRLEDIQKSSTSKQYWTGNSWARVFNYLPKELPQLTTVYFQNLKYSAAYSGRPRTLPDHPGSDAHRHPFYQPAIIAAQPNDRKALKELLESLNEKRTRLGLEPDAWMSGFGYEEACRPLPADIEDQQPGPYDVFIQ